VIALLAAQLLLGTDLLVSITLAAIFTAFFIWL
jgi:hypothetical protein